MSSYKLAIVIGTRPEIIRLSEVIKRIKITGIFDLYLIHTGQNYDYELNQIFFEDLSLPSPDIFLNSAAESPIQTISNILRDIEQVFNNIAPDALLVLGDTNSSLSTIAAKRLRIPIFHYEAGNRYNDQRVPEEINRKIVDHLSDVNFTYSLHAKTNLINEGVPSHMIHNIGSPMYEIISANKIKIEKSKILKTLKLEEKRYFLISCHRDEIVENENFSKTFENLLTNIHRKYKLPIVISTHPRTRKKINKINNDEILFLKPFSFSDYVNLQLNALVVMSDSGTIQEEASILGLNAINLREHHERQESLENISTILTGLKVTKIIESIDYLIHYGILNYEAHPEYTKKSPSEALIRNIYSYIDYVNKKTWGN